MNNHERIKRGFKIKQLIMRDADTGEVLFTSGPAQWDKAFQEEVKVEVPARVLKCKAVSREMTFSSREMIKSFRLEQLVKLQDQAIEQWNFEFGFVIPGSTNTWQCVIESAGEGQVLPAEILSGNVVIDTDFYDGNEHVGVSKIRVYYV